MANTAIVVVQSGLCGLSQDFLGNLCAFPLASIVDAPVSKPVPGAYESRGSGLLTTKANAKLPKKTMASPESASLGMD